VTQDAKEIDIVGGDVSTGWRCPLLKQLSPRQSSLNNRQDRRLISDE
jgi:hypothetical protein